MPALALPVAGVGAKWDLSNHGTQRQSEPLLHTSAFMNQKHTVRVKKMGNALEESMATPHLEVFKAGRKKRPTGLRTWTVGSMLALQEFDPQNAG